MLGVDPKPELLEVFALISEALARSIPVVAHNASFDVGRLNHTALRHGVSVTPLRYVSMLCTICTMQPSIADCASGVGRQSSLPEMRSSSSTYSIASLKAVCIVHCLIAV